jgi:hypothetical protein
MTISSHGVDGSSSCPAYPEAGAYGKAAHDSVQDSKPEELVDASIRFTPKSSFGADGSLKKQGLYDYMTYAEEDIKLFDTDQSGTLNERELTTAYGGDAKKAEQFMTAVNQDGKAGIGTVDMTAYLIAQDGPRQLFAGLGYPHDFAGKFDGQSTPEERAALDDMIFSDKTRPGGKDVTNNQVAGEGLSELQSKLGLEKEYQSRRGSA